MGRGADDTHKAWPYTDAQVRFSIVLPIRTDETRPLSVLTIALHTWSRQSPVEIVVVDISADTAIEEICHRNVYIPISPTPVPNFSHALNVGIRAAAGEYIVCTGYEMLASENYLEVLNKYVAPDKILGGHCGFLPRDLTPKYAVDNWDRVCATLSPDHGVGYEGRDGGYYPMVGTVQVMHRDKWNYLRGFDERILLAGADGDIIRRAVRLGLKRIIIGFDEAQLLHPWHPKGKWHGSLPIDRSIMWEKTIIRNQKGWGRV